MTTDSGGRTFSPAQVEGWFVGRLPEEWTALGAPTVSVDRDEVVVTVAVAEPDLHGSSAGDGLAEGAVAEARAGRARAFRESTRQARMEIATEAQHRFGRQVSWAVRVGPAGQDAPYEELWTHLAAPVMTRLRQPQRMVLDTLVEAGVARSRSDALGWCVRLVGQHQEEWLQQLRDALVAVEEVRRAGPPGAAD